ncbi:MAG: FAD-dependent oxidoreductase [Erysipelotrichales bacterium]|nr:FAD-dependent oxidoreductase [Erysipelotrichales bacterium]
MKKQITRRDFLKGTASLAAVGLLGACASGNSGEQNNTTTDVKWDLESDVVILGAGGSGMCAGIEARKAGATALILEKTDAYGGTSIRSGGIIQASGTRVQKELTNYKDDTGEKHAEYYIQEASGLVDADLVKDMTTNSNSHIEWLESLGLVFTNMSGSAHVNCADESLYADRIHGTDVGAAGMFNAVHDEAVNQGVEIKYNCCADKLIMVDGVVAGVEATLDGNKVNVKANKGVIICTSSFDHNVEMAKRLSPNHYYDLTTQHVVAYPGNTGDGIRMGMEIGADITNLGGVIDLTSRTSAGINRQTPLLPCIFVNSDGVRYQCEDNTYALTSKQRYEEIIRTGKPVYTVFGASSLPYGAMTEDSLKAEADAGTAFVGNTIAELAEKIGVNAKNLERTINIWNEDMATGVDTQYHRQSGLTPITGPYYAFEEGFLNLGAIGGLRINLDTQVLDVNGNAIPNLYAAGMASAGWIGQFYPGSGTALLGCVHFGRKAGKIVASK